MALRGDALLQASDALLQVGVFLYECASKDYKFWLHRMVDNGMVVGGTFQQVGSYSERASRGEAPVCTVMRWGTYEEAYNSFLAENPQYHQVLTGRLFEEVWQRNFANITLGCRRVDCGNDCLWCKYCAEPEG